MKVISLFSGCGGLDLGFERAGFEIPIANVTLTVKEECNESSTRLKLIGSIVKSENGGRYFVEDEMGEVLIEA